MYIKISKTKIHTKSNNKSTNLMPEIYKIQTKTKFKSKMKVN